MNAHQPSTTFAPLTLWRLALCVLPAFACHPVPPPQTAPAPVEPAPEPPAPASAWPEVVRLSGSIEVPGQALAFHAQLELAGATPSGTLHIPSQTLHDAPLERIEVDGEMLRFVLGAAEATWQVERKPSGELACMFSQKAISVPCSVKEVSAQELSAKLAPPARPQTPAPPYPYDALEVTYDNTQGGVKLTGTLTLPTGAGPFPVVLLITGSGPQDRDETLFHHKPFLVLADHLARNGIAALRVDDRGVGGSTSNGNATMKDSADDVRAGLAFLKTQPRVDKKRMGLLGHSEGALIGPMVAAANKDVAFMVALAAPAVPGSELLVAQVGAVLTSLGAPPELVEKAQTQQRLAVEVIASERDPDKARARLLEILGPGGEAQIEAALDPRFHELVTYDPGPTLARVKCPLLALYGVLDTQVPADQNAPAAEQALRLGKNKRGSVQRLDRLNHLFQPARTGAPSEYPEIETTLDPQVLTLTTRFIHEQVDSKR